ncbi:MAG: pentapeptide repeat-containing protein, partial [Okeania sp. SIO1H6]|nr:pentapeptide repeat-containing protein [Okeania sp. SIO1H6]
RLTGAILRGANLQGAILEKADFENANLAGVNFKGAHLEGANFQGAVTPKEAILILGRIKYKLVPPSPLEEISP